MLLLCLLLLFATCAATDKPPNCTVTESREYIESVLKRDILYLRKVENNGPCLVKFHDNPKLEQFVWCPCPPVLTKPCLTKRTAASAPTILATATDTATATTNGNEHVQRATATVTDTATAKNLTTDMATDMAMATDTATAIATAMDTVETTTKRPTASTLRISKLTLSTSTFSPTTLLSTATLTTSAFRFTTPPSIVKLTTSSSTTTLTTSTTTLSTVDCFDFETNHKNDILKRPEFILLKMIMQIYGPSAGIVIVTLITLLYGYCHLGLTPLNLVYVFRINKIPFSKRKRCFALLLKEMTKNNGTVNIVLSNMDSRTVDVELGNMDTITDNIELSNLDTRLNVVQGDSFYSAHSL